MHGPARNSSTSRAELGTPIEVEKDGNRVCGTSIMGLMMLGAAMGDTIIIHVEGDRCRRGARQAGRAGRGPLRRRVMPRQVTAFSNSTVKLLRSLRDKKARRAEGLFLAEGLRILDRGARQRAAAGDRRLFARRGATPARRRDHRRDRSGGRRCDRDHARHPFEDERQGQSADAARRLPPAGDVARAGSTAPRRRCGSSPRRCAIPAISARSSGPATRSAPAG